MSIPVPGRADQHRPTPYLVSGRPEETTQLWQWSAQALSAAVRERQVSVTEIVQAHLGRCADLNAHLNALVEVSESEALERARQLDRQDTGLTCGPLHGVPVAVKDNTDQAGHPNTNGVLALAANIAMEDAAVVAAMRAAGAVFIGRSNLPAFSLRWCAENDLYGRTLNPWDPARTPGGSTGGGAAAVAAGLVAVAHGNDYGGSLRYPAAMCGVTGLRPTVGRVSKWAHPSPVNTPSTPTNALMAVEGPIARHVGDLRLALTAMSRPDLRDPAAVPAPYADEAPPPPGGVVGLVRDVPGIPTAPAQAAALELAAAWLADGGYQVEAVDMPALAEAHRLVLLLLIEDLRTQLPDLLRWGDTQLRATLGNYLAVATEEWGPSPSLEDFIRGLTRRNDLVRTVQHQLCDMALLLTPVSGETTPEHGADCGPLPRARRLLHNQWPMTSIACLGLPAVTVPVAVRDGLPVGVQLVGARFRDSWVLDAAQVVEDRAGTFTPIEPVA